MAHWMHSYYTRKSMVKETEFIKLHEALSRVLRHPLLQKVDLETAIQYTVDFIEVFGLPKMFQDRQAEIHIHDFRGELPCDLISIKQVREKCSGECLRGMTDSFDPDHHRNVRKALGYTVYGEEMTFKTQNRVIFTSFPEGDIIIAYKAIPVDEDGYPLILDNAVYLRALESYIKKEAFTILFDQNKISAAVLQNAQADYAWRAGQLHNEFVIPSVSEMEAICRSWCTMLQRTTDFDHGFRHLGDREYIRRH